MTKSLPNWEILKPRVYGVLEKLVFPRGIVRVIDGEVLRFPIEFARFYPSDSEPFKTNFILENALGNALDLGAHIGLYTVLLSRKCVSVVAVEPIDITRNALAKTLEFNGCKNVTIRSECVSDFNGLGTIFDTGTRASNANSIAPIGSPIQKEMRTIDDFHSEFSFIKIDIEGAEVKALRGALKTLKYVRFLTIEIHPNLISLLGDNPEEVFEILGKFNPQYFLNGLEKSPLELLAIKSQYEINVVLHHDFSIAS